MIVNWASRWMQRTPPVFRSICVIHISINATKMPAVYILVLEAMTVNATWVLLGMAMNANLCVMYRVIMVESVPLPLCVTVLLGIRGQIAKKTSMNVC